ncbi:CU044_5270 family protein [Amycolatopsis sp. NPDC059235]|uniref:CU044_5270 family protein n=1 Tax=Amycolatopsis sp. NPDC059235 TaxID=3346782 RepID=UPI00366FC785
MTENNVRRLWTNDELDEALASLRAEEPTGRRTLAAANNALVNAVRSLEGKSIPAPETAPLTEFKGKPASRAGRRWWISAAAAAAVIAVGVTVVTTGADSSGPTSASAPRVKFLSVRQALNTAADKIHVIGETPVPAGKFRYVATRTWLLWNDSRVPAAFAGEQLTQTWQPSDFAGQWLLKTAPTGSRKWLIGDEQTLKAGTEKLNGGHGADLSEYWPSGEWRAAGGKFSGKAMAIVGRSADEWGAPTEQRLADLPRDPQQLYDLMAADLSVVNKPKLGGVLDIAAQLLKTGTLPADLKESLYRAVAKIPGLKVTEQVANLDGRTGVALGVDPVDGTFRMEIIVDPATGEFIGERRTRLKRDDNDITTAGINPGTVTFSSSVQTAVADEQGVVPPGQ